MNVRIVTHQWWLGLAGLLGLVLIGSGLRIHEALHDPGFDRTSSRGMLRTDPAILFYETKRIIEANGHVPADFRADPRLEYPDRVDFAAIETPGHEFVVAW